MAGLFSTKSVDQLIADSESHVHSLKKTLSAWDLVAMGIGAIIGTGIFVLTGVVAIRYAGSGLILSFVICAVACIFAALCYAEFASLIPIAGSAYTFSYASLGELIAWIIGWDLILEYGLSTGAVASGWSGYFVKFLGFFGISWPTRWALSPFSTVMIHGHLMHGIVDLPALLSTLLITWLLIVGIKESANVNNIIVAIKVGISIFFIGLGLYFVHPAYWHPIVPKFVPSHSAPRSALNRKSAAETPTARSEKRGINIWKTELWKLIAEGFGYHIQQGFGGWAGIFLGAAIIFFAYIGFDAVSTTSEEAKNPPRDLPIGIIGSLLVSTVLYILMAAVFTGIVKCDGTLKLSSLGINKRAPLVYAFQLVHNPWVSKYAAFLITIGALCGITSVLLVELLGQSRIFFAMARDGLLPLWISQVHPKYRTPWIGTLVTGIAVALVAGFIPLGDIAEMANIGTLFAFVLVSGGIIFLRKYQPDKIAAFRTPFVPYVPILSILFCFVLMMSLPVVTWIRFVVWLVIGLAIYFFYGVKHSTLRNGVQPTSTSSSSFSSQ
jgi:APA family basic amino acid/polyamine antiporter